MPPARRRSLACAATSASSSATCSCIARDLGADALATGHYVRRVGRRAQAAPCRRRAADQSYFLFATTRRSSISCAFRWATCPRPRPAGSQRASVCRLPTSPTARTSASCPTAPTPPWWRSCAPARPSRARSSCRRPRARAACRHHPLHGRPAPRARDRDRRAPLCRAARARARRVIVGPKRG